MTETVRPQDLVRARGPLRRWVWAPRHLWNGLVRFRYPPCCVLRFSIESVICKYPIQARKRGCVDKRYVPCNFFHRAGEKT